MNMTKQHLTSRCLPSFYVFIAVLRTLATCLITNTHYGNIYPVSQFAVGGLIGDVVFFSVSGFCLMRSAKTNFFKWYGKRVKRIYPALFFVGLAFWALEKNEIYSFADFIKIFFYPTQYHFITSIVLLYILFYPIVRFPILQKKIPFIMLGVFVLWILYYIFWFDKSLRLDVAAYPITRFLFFECMLLGAFVKNNIHRFLNAKSWKKWLWVLSSLILYFLSKVVIDRYHLMDLQFIIILLIFSVGASLLIAFCSINDWLACCKPIEKIATFFAPLTLEIYIVQGVIIDLFENLFFPMNFIVTTVAIIASAWLVHNAIKVIQRLNQKID